MATTIDSMSCSIDYSCSLKAACGYKLLIACLAVLTVAFVEGCLCLQAIDSMSCSVDCSCLFCAGSDQFVYAYYQLLSLHPDLNQLTTPEVVRAIANN